MSKNNLEFTGKVKKIYDLEEGISSSGKSWSNQTILLEEQVDQFPQIAAFKIFGEKIEQFDINLHDVVTVSFNLKSREWSDRSGNVRVDTSASVWKITK